MTGRSRKIPHPSADWYRPLAAHLGEAYLRYGFTYGTQQEVDFLWEALRLEPGKRLLDVGCGPGRHSIAFAKKGAQVTAIDISAEFADIARAKAKEADVSVAVFELDAHALPFNEEFDATISLCEGAFGLGLDDLRIIRGMSDSTKPGGMVAVGAPNFAYVVAHLTEDGSVDLDTSLFEEQVQVKGADGEDLPFKLVNSCYTPRELKWLANGASLRAQGVYGVLPGAYGKPPPTLDHPEILLIATKPAKTS